MCVCVCNALRHHFPSCSRPPRSLFIPLAPVELVFPSQIPLIFPLVEACELLWKLICGYRARWHPLGGMLPGHPNISWVVICDLHVWLTLGKSLQEAAEGEEVAAAVMMAETPNPATGMSCSPVTSRPVTQREASREELCPHAFGGSAHRFLAQRCM